MLPPAVIFLMGPTACGKTNISLELAKLFRFEIVSVDSMMVYRELDIGTAKPSKNDLTRYRHHLIDIRDPSEPYSAGEFRHDALNAINDILSRGKTPLLVGGSMLYFHVLENGIAELPRANPMIREQLEHRIKQEGIHTLYQFLTEVDPQSAKQLHPNDTQRIARALEIYLSTGQSMTALHHLSTTALSGYTLYRLALIPQNRKLLHERIEQRFEHMLRTGLMDEVMHLYRRIDLSPGLPALRSVGYKQIFPYFAKQYDFASMREHCLSATRRLAKRQLTWLRTWPNLEIFNADEDSLSEKVLARVAEIIKLHRLK